jgi:AcrR family transcriptional regulator
VVEFRLGNVYADNMTINANSVNIKNAPRAYHHGDLSAALIAQGLRLLESGDAASFSLREVARGVGVSAPAVYRHFPDKAAFLAALAQEGLNRLAHDQAAAQVGHPEGFAASGRAYVRFALANPGLFRLIFASAHHAGPDLEHDPQGSAGWQLREHVAHLLGPDARAEQYRVLAYRAWALVHGLSMLILDQQIARGEGLKLLDAIVSSDSLGQG